MAKDKYPRQMEAIVFIIFQSFFATRAVLKGYGSTAHEAKPNGLLTRGS